VCIPLLPVRATRPTCHILPNLSPLGIFGDQYKSRSCSLRIFLQSPLTFPSISPSTFLSILCSISLSSRVHKFSKHPRATSKAQAPVPHYGPGKFRRHRTKFCRLEDLAPRISAPLSDPMYFLECERPRFTPIHKTGKVTVMYVSVLYFDSQRDDTKFRTRRLDLVYSCFLCGYAVVQLAKALRYNPKGRGFDSRCLWNFSLTSPLRTVRPIYRTGVPLPSRCCILYIFFNNYKY